MLKLVPGGGQQIVDALHRAPGMTKEVAFEPVDEQLTTIDEGYQAR